ncbi:hypothetical protein [Nocardia vermiculata]|uniref:DUF2269 family protein n=1 Tax=Nocardia vermiculata TaxID=257274 RepID=A0A846Y075_9NOCA|nr:hypothetical protein [Nocardia vermiculata]NKY51051.1 hypothetical protein [Nocardia vermiculata]
MTEVLLSLHVLAALIAIGPVTVAASMFPAAVRGTGAANPVVLHRVCRVYAGVGCAVPVLGFATAAALGVLGDGWLSVSIALTLAAAALLGVMILPDQRAALAGGEGIEKVAGRLAMTTGIFNVLWATVTVLMIVRPGSTTGA